MAVVIILPVIISYILGALLDEDNPVTHNFVQDWFNHARSLLVFLIGFVLVRMPLIWNRFSSLRWHFLLIAIFTYAYILFSFNGGSLNGLFGGESDFARVINRIFWTANGWFWMLTLIAWAQYWFTFSNPLLKYLNGGVYCFYILHQTLIIVIAYFLVPLKLGAMVEPLLLTSAVAMSCVVLFEILRRLIFVRGLFGIQARS
jgi:hypothetical protein